MSNRLGRHGACLVVVLGLLGAVPAAAQPPSPLDPSLFAFPGSWANPGSARSAALAMADAWLGSEPYLNPAAPAVRGVSLSPVLTHVSRQDLRAANRDFDEQGAFFDGAGASLGEPLGRGAVWLYACQPVLRLEDNAFNRGRLAFDPANPPAALATHSEMREVVVGLAGSYPVGPVRLGLAGEWRRRDDVYETTERSGSPEAGFRHLDFSGSGMGVQAGAHYEHGDSTLGAFALGAAVRFLPALSMSGEQRFELLTGDSLASVDVERDAGWEAGVSSRLTLTPDADLFLALAARGAQRWDAFDLGSGSGFSWRIGSEYHPFDVPWTLRLGVGEEQQSGVPEARAGLVGLGFGWQFSGTRVDVGLLHRTFERVASPNSFDDRVVGTVTTTF